MSNQQGIPMGGIDPIKTSKMIYDIDPNIVNSSLDVKEMGADFPSITLEEENNLKGNLKKKYPDLLPEERFEKAKKLVEQKTRIEENKKKQSGKPQTGNQKDEAIFRKRAERLNKMAPGMGDKFLKDKGMEVDGDNFLTNKDNTNLLVRGAKGVLGGMYGAVEGFGEGVQEGGKNLIEDAKRILSDDSKNPAEKFNQILLGEIGADFLGEQIIGGTIGGGLEGLYKGFTTETNREYVNDKVKNIVQDLANYATEDLEELGPDATGAEKSGRRQQEMVQNILKKYNSLEEGEQQELNDLLGYGLGGSEFLGFGLLKKPVQKGATQVLEAGLDVLEKAKPVGERILKEGVDIIGQPVNTAVDATRGTRDFITKKAAGIEQETLDIIRKDPYIMEAAMNGDVTVDSQIDDIVVSIKNKKEELSDIGTQYNDIVELGGGGSVKTSDMVVDIDNYLDTRDIRVVDGKLDFSESKIGNAQARKAIQDVYDEVMSQSEYEAKGLLNLRGRIDDKIDELPHGSSRSKSESIKNAIRGIVDTKAKKNIDGLAEIDAKYSENIKLLNKLLKEYTYKDGDLKDNIVSKITNLANTPNKLKLERLEKVLPGIGDKARALKAIQDITRASASKTGTYVQAALLGGGGFMLGGWLGAAAMAVLTNPKFVTSMLIKKAKSKKWAKEVVSKIKKGDALTDDELKNVANNIDLNEMPNASNAVDDVGGAVDDNILSSQSKPKDLSKIDSYTNRLNEARENLKLATTEKAKSGYRKLIKELEDLIEHSDDASFNKAGTAESAVAIEEARGVIKEFDNFKKTNKNSWAVDAVDQDDVIDAASDGRLIINENGGRGLVTKDGDIKYIFKVGNEKGVVNDILDEAINKGGVKMDNFDGPLTKMYEKKGFRVTSRMKYNKAFEPDGIPSSVSKSEPDVVFMVYDPDNLMDIKVKTFAKDNYDEALAYRESFLNNVSNESDNIELIHYSPKNDLTEIDPNYMGESINAGEEMKTQFDGGKMKEGYLPKSNFYTPESTIIEKRFTNFPVYRTSIPRKDLYIVKNNYMPSDVEIKKLGYKGYLLNGQVRLFDKVNVENIGRSTTRKSDFVKGDNYKDFIK